MTEPVVETSDLETPETEAEIIALPFSAGRRLCVVEEASLDLSVTFMTNDEESDRERMFPLVDWFLASRPEIAEEEADRTTFATTMTVPNAAFLIKDMAEEFETITKQIALLEDNGLSVEHGRALQQMADWMEETSQIAGRIAGIMRRGED